MAAASSWKSEGGVKDRKVLGKKDVHISMQDTVTTAQFQAIWSSLGLQISQGYVDAIFNKYGQDARGRMPILVRMERTGKLCRQ
eukprot:1161445-Pelagomonas_calceolata.AAC.11